MKKHIIAPIITLLLLFTLAPTALAATIPTERQKARLVDDADILDTVSENKLLSYLNELSEELECDIAVVTVNDLGGKGAQAYADDYYDRNGYGYGKGDDGLLFLISMTERRWAISTYGLAFSAIGERDLDILEDEIVPYLSAGRYYDAFTAFAELSYEMIEEHKRTGGKTPFAYGKAIVISLGIGLVGGLIAVTVMKGKLKSVRSRADASEYIGNGGLKLSLSRDRYLYRTVTKVPRPKQSSSGGGGGHVSSSGRSHGGRSGGF